MRGDQGYLFTYDGERFHPAAIHGEPRFVEWQWQLGPFQPAGNTPFGRIRGGEPLIHIPNVGEEDVSGLSRKSATWPRLAESEAR